MNWRTIGLVHFPSLTRVTQGVGEFGAAIVGPDDRVSQWLAPVIQRNDAVHGRTERQPQHLTLGAAFLDHRLNAILHRPQNFLRILFAPARLRVNHGVFFTEFGQDFAFEVEGDRFYIGSTQVGTDDVSHALMVNGEW